MQKSVLVICAACWLSWILKKRIKGSHHIFYRQDVEEILNLQPRGSKAKPYQVGQVRQVILKYRLGGDIDG